MSPEVAQQVVVGITLLGAVVWLISLNFLVNSARLMRQHRGDGFDEPPDRKCLTGGAEIEGEPKNLASRAAEALAKFTLGPVKNLEKTEDCITFERVGGAGANQPASRWFQRGELRFTPLHGNRTQVEWAVEPGNFRWLLGVGSIVQAVGLIALAVGCWAVLTYVARSPNPAVRWQSFQMFQVVHLLWPPFLFAGLYRSGVRGITAEFEALANNLAYLGNQS
jgi:hypothetical protein